MKKFLLIAASAAFALSATAAPAEVRFVNLGNKQLNEKRAAIVARINRATDESKLVWKPGKQDNYFWITEWDDASQAEIGKWTLASEVTYTYSDEGKLASTKQGDGTETRFEYDAEGRLISETNYSPEGEALEKYEYAYDSVIKNLIVRNANYVMDGSEWMLRDESLTEITRNSDNNITQISEFEYHAYYGEKTEEERAVYTYGDDKKINTIKVYYDDEDGELQLAGEMTDVKWAKTNGQVVDLDMDELKYYFSDNQIASATMPKATNEPYLGDIFVKAEYKAGLGGFNVTQTMNNEVIVSYDFTITDTYGSFTARSFEVDFDNDGDDVWFRDGEDLYDVTRTYDKFGNVLVQKQIYYEDADPEKIEGITEYLGNVVYDPENGYPTEYTSTQNYDGHVRNNNRIVWSDYKSFEAGIGAIATDNENAPVEYFDLRGQRVDNPANGFFIRRQGDKVEKIVVR